MIVCTHIEYSVHSTLAALVTHTMSKWHSSSRMYTNFNMSTPNDATEASNLSNLQHCLSEFITQFQIFPRGEKSQDVILTDLISQQIRAAWLLSWFGNCWLWHACTTKLYCGVHHLSDTTQNAAVLKTI